MASFNDLNPSLYLSAADLKGKQQRATIEYVEVDEFEQDGRKKKKAVVSFKGGSKSLILNKTNGSMLVEITGSDDTDGWVGTTVMLMPTRVPFQGKIVDAIRIAKVPIDVGLDDAIPF